MAEGTGHDRDTTVGGAWGGDTDTRARTAVVTGASSGIGRAIAIELGRLGWRVAVGARRTERLLETAAEIAEVGGTPFTHALDVTDERSVDEFFEATRQAAGPVEVLVNNAGLGYLGAIAETTSARLRATIETNLLGALLCTRAATSQMLEHGVRGDVVFISSDSIQQPYPHMLTYGATKAAVEYVASGLDVELGGTGIRVSTVRLGPTVSEFNTSWPDEDMIGFMRAWERLGLKQDFNYIPAEAVAHAVTTAVTAPTGTKVSLLSVRPEVTVSDDDAKRWADAADQGRRSRAD
jgi:NADP-dependent 3-hydroxy acid dehydrogenase YdfG